jgi:hypothetical protein
MSLLNFCKSYLHFSVSAVFAMFGSVVFTLIFAPIAIGIFAILSATVITLIVVVSVAASVLAVYYSLANAGRIIFKRLYSS